MHFSFLLSLLLFSIGCNIQVKLDERAAEVPSFSFPVLSNLTGSVFNNGSNVVVTSTAIDNSNNVYVYLNFIGSMDGAASENRDMAILKLNSSGALLWKIHFNSALPEIQDASLDEASASMIWNESEKALYFLGSTKSAFIEPNLSTQPDLVIGKVSGEGKILWIRHFGETSVPGPALDISKIEAPGTLSLSPDKKLLVTFETYGAFFEASAGDADVAVMKLVPATGSLYSGRQLGGQTLGDYGTLHSVSVNGNLREGLTSSNIAFDGSKIIIPIRTRGHLVETNPNTANNDAGYVVFNEDLSVHRIKQLGSETYSAWVTAGNYSGAINGDNQFRGVIVHGPEDYLFYGKTTGSVAEPLAGVSDFLFARYKNHSLVKLIQHGSITRPGATNSDEPRFMLKDSKGNIYCSGHSRSSLFENLEGNINPFIMRVDEDGMILAGVQFGQTTSHAAGMTGLHYSLVTDNEFAIKDGRILMSVSNDPVGTTNFTSYLWSFPAP